MFAFSPYFFLPRTGTVLMFLGNQNLSVELDALQDSGLDKIDDIKTFLENTIEVRELFIKICKLL